MRVSGRTVSDTRGLLALVCLLFALLGTLAAEIGLRVELVPSTRAALKESHFTTPQPASSSASSAVTAGDHSVNGAEVSEFRAVVRVPQPRWSQLPRVLRPIGRDVVHAPHRVQARVLMRSSTFNPRDIELSYESRVRVKDLCEHAGTDLQSLVAQIRQVREDEFCRLHEAGVAIELNHDALELSLESATLGRDPAFCEIQGRTLAVARQHLLDSRAMEAQLVATGRQLLGALVGEFLAAGALEPVEAKSLLQRGWTPGPR